MYMSVLYTVFIDEKPYNLYKENGSRPDETAGNVESEQSNFKGTCYVLS